MVYTGNMNFVNQVSVASTRSAGLVLSSKCPQTLRVDLDLSAGTEFSWLPAQALLQDLEACDWCIRGRLM